MIGNTVLTVDGALARSALVRPGTKIGLGPYDIVVGSAEGKDLALDIELVRPLGDDLAELKARSVTELSGVSGLGKRGWSWLLFLVVAALFLALPLYAVFNKPEASRLAHQPVKTEKHWGSDFDTLWLSGTISSPHAFFGNECETCHQEPFVQVRDQACLNCHAGIEHHADPKVFPTATFADVTCQRCHKEHSGPAAIVLAEQSFCVSCHVDLKQREPESHLQNVDDFARHPQFRPTVIVDPQAKHVERRLVGGSPSPREKSGLTFPHDKHLIEKGVRHPEKGTVQLVCADCHRPEPGGLGMAPIRMEEHCIGCHRLSFEPKAPDRVLPHGKPHEAVEQLRDFYAHVALRGGFDDPEAPPSVRRMPGTDLTPEGRTQSLAWAHEKAELVASTSFGKSLCGTCHVVTARRSGEYDTWDIVRPQLADRWLPKGRFDHGKHQQVACAECHAAKTSQSAQDVLLPGIAICQDCHGGEAATSHVPSTCIDCHDFHLPNLPPMKEPLGNVATTAANP